MQFVHFITHEIEISLVYLSRNLQVLQLFIVLACCLDSLLKMTCSRVDDYVFLGSGIVAHEVVLPCCDALADEREGILSFNTFLVHTDGEV